MKSFKINRTLKKILIGLIGIIVLAGLLYSIFYYMVIYPWMRISLKDSIEVMRVFTFNKNLYIEKRIIGDEFHKYYLVKKNRKTIIFEFIKFRSDTAMRINVEANKVQFYHWNTRLNYKMYNSKIGKFVFEIKILNPDDYEKFPSIKEEYLIRRVK